MYGRLQSKQDEYADDKKKRNPELHPGPDVEPPPPEEIPEAGELPLDEAAAGRADSHAKPKQQVKRRS